MNIRKIIQTVALIGLVLFAAISARAGQEGAGKTVAFIAAENEYQAAQTLPEFGKWLTAQYGFHCEYLIGSSDDKDPKRHFIPGMEKLKKADLVVLFARRRALPLDQMQALHDYLDAGKPLIGIRTACHAFDAKFTEPGEPPVKGAAGPLPAGMAQLKAFDREVLGCTYFNHYRPTPEGTSISIDPKQAGHPILRGVPKSFKSVGTLYRILPLTSGAQALMWGRIAGQKAEPVVITHTYKKGGRIVYTSLGHWEDFKIPPFRRLLTNSVFWALKLDAPKAD